MFNQEHNEESGGAEMGEGWMGCCTEHMHHLPMKVKKEFKMAILRKKEKMLEAKLAFIREMKDMVEKWQPEEEKEKEEKA
jgi:hypothetical protein